MNKRINVLLILICLVCVTSTIYMRITTQNQCDDYNNLLNQREDLKKDLSSKDTEIARLEQELSIRDITIAELDSKLSQNADISLFDKYFSEINWDNLGYDEIYQINKQIAISANLFDLEHISQKVELNNTLIQLLDDAVSKTTDKTFQKVLECMIDDLKEENEFLSTILKQLMKENLEIQGYDEVVIQPSAG